MRFLRWRRAGISTVSMLVFLLGGSSGAGEAAARGEAGAEASEACAVLADEEIQRVLGLAPGPGEGSRIEQAVSVCRWATRDGAESLLYLILAPRTVVSQPELAARVARVFGEPREFRSVPGLGDFAVWISLMGEPAALQVYWREYLLQIGIETDAPDRADAARQLAVLALARLPISS